jgi:hypothetical protein
MRACSDGLSNGDTPRDGCKYPASRMRCQREVGCNRSAITILLICFRGLSLRSTPRYLLQSLRDSNAAVRLCNYLKQPSALHSHQRIDEHPDAQARQKIAPKTASPHRQKTRLKQCPALSATKPSSLKDTRHDSDKLLTTTPGVAAKLFTIAGDCGLFHRPVSAD